MPVVKKIEAKDIGGELLPVITRGLYRNALDAVREYLQNSIDADATEVALRVSRDLITVEDNGSGMDFDTAETAVKLGISQKNPVYDVGFRGIGIYSAFDLCDELEILTKSVGSRDGYVITFNFGRMRELLKADEERKRRGKKTKMYLEKLLNETVLIQVDPNRIVKNHGTIVLLKSIRSEYQKGMLDTTQMIDYLQSMVPLPFDPSFSYAEKINAKLRAKDYRTINVRLITDGFDGLVYRPYNNEIFAHGRGYSPKFFDIISPISKRRYGFCWVCHNDARRVLENWEMRGILIKKFGFSISSRKYLESYFPRVVFYRRLTGELIVQHKNLIPNAARSDFEHNQSRADFIVALINLVEKITEWANEIQQTLKAKEELQEIAPRASEINDELVQIRRDVPALLQANVEIAYLKKRLATHEHYMSKFDKELHGKTLRLVHKAEKTIHSLLSTKGKQKRESKAALDEALSALKYKATEDELEDREEQPKSFLELMETTGLIKSPSLKEAIVYIDELLKQVLPPTKYLQELSNLKSVLEEQS